MERKVVINNKSLEELLERLLRWNELCAQLRELYYRYLDLAAFRSEKCLFPGRKCRRSWRRQYDVGDLTLMWTYIANTAPLCGTLMRALAEVEYKARVKSLESFEKHGGVERRGTSKGHELVSIRLKRPIHAYLVLWQNKLYVVWREFYDVPEHGSVRSFEITHKLVGIIRRSGKRIDVIDEYEIDREYERLWFEVPLSKGVSKLLGNRDRAPVALFRNVGWLLSDDSRRMLDHSSSNAGQVALRLFDWIALATYADKDKQLDEPLIFKLSVLYVNKTKSGVKPKIQVRPIGLATEKILTVYNLFDIFLGEPEETFARGYAVLKALREEATRREGQMYVVNDVGAWIAFSSAVATLVLGDGYVAPFRLIVASKFTSELSEALGGTPSRSVVILQGRHIRLLLPPPPTPAFKKSMNLYKTLANFPSSAIVEINGVKYLLTHKDGGRFAISIRKADGLHDAAKRLGLNVSVRNGMLVFTYTQLMKLAKRFPVLLLTDMEKDVVKEVRQVVTPDVETLKNVIEVVAKMAEITIRLRRNGSKIVPYVLIKPYDKSKLEVIVEMLKSAGIRLSIHRRYRYIFIVERKSVETIRAALPQIFSRFNVLHDVWSSFMRV